MAEGGEHVAGANASATHKKGLSLPHRNRNGTLESGGVVRDVCVRHSSVRPAGMGSDRTEPADWG